MQLLKWKLLSSAFMWTSLFHRIKTPLVRWEEQLLQDKNSILGEMLSPAPSWVTANDL